MAIFSGYGEEEVSRTITDEPPIHFSFMIKSFSLLSYSFLKSWSADFEAGGYQWKLCLYPNGNKDRDGEGHISLYLEMSETNSLSPGWEVHAFFKLFIHDQLRDKYLTLQDANGKARRFRATKTQSGFDRFITQKEFNDPSEGYLINDTCVFGAEVYVHRDNVVRKGQCLSLKADSLTFKHRWTIEKFSELADKSYSSEVFIVGGHKWKIRLWPNGQGGSKGQCISLYLVLEDDPKSLIGQGVYVDAKMLVIDQVYGNHLERIMEPHWFNHSNKSWGWRDFLSLRKLRDQSGVNLLKDVWRDFLYPGGLRKQLKSYLVKDVCIIEVHFLLVGAIEQLTLKSK